MTGRPVALLFIVAVVLSCTTVIVTQPACGAYPDKTCYGDKVNALAEDAGLDPRAAGCTTCLQQSKCCDATGACGDDPACTDEFKDMQRCMIDNGLSKEAECKSRLLNTKSKTLYECMREPCGKSCGVPSCDLNPAVTLFVSPTCDRCIGSGCCDKVNACYGNRQCKLFLECITNHCPKTTGPSMTTLSTLEPDLIANFEAAVCGDASADTTRGADPGPCLDRCLAEFAQPVTGSVEENRAATCLAVGVYTCGARNNCGPPCTTSSDSVLGAYPEDSLDAGP